MDRMNSLTIGRAAREAGVGVETVRYYERRGLIRQPLKPPRSGFRVYSDATVARIRFIRQAQEIGFSLREVEELLSLVVDPATDCSSVRGMARRKREEVERKIAQLRRVRGALDGLIASCPGRGPLRSCSIVDMLLPAKDGAAERRNDKRSTGLVTLRRSSPVRRRRHGQE